MFFAGFSCYVKLFMTKVIYLNFLGKFYIKCLNMVEMYFILAYINSTFAAN